MSRNDKTALLTPHWLQQFPSEHGFPGPHTSVSVAHVFESVPDVVDAVAVDAEMVDVVEVGLVPFKQLLWQQTPLCFQSQ